MTSFITTDPDGGAIITTEGGKAIAADVATSNRDIQQFNLSVNLLRSILWQYNQATALQSLINTKQAWYDSNQSQFWQDWFDNVFNLNTANEFGLAVWSIILNLPLFISQGATPVDVPVFGFGPGNSNFNNSNFGVRNGGTNSLPIETKRLALKLRYFQICSSGTVPEINRFMNYAFSALGKVVLIDNHDMSQTYVFFFPLTWDLKYLFDNVDILPRPAGVLTNYRDTTESPWGFGPGNVNFNNGNFAS